MQTGWKHSDKQAQKEFERLYGQLQELKATVQPVSPSAQPQQSSPQVVQTTSTAKELEYNDDLLFDQKKTQLVNRFDELGTAVKTLFDIMPTAAEDVDNLPFGIASFEQGDEIATGVRTLFDLYRVIEAGTNITLTDNGYSIRIDSASGATSNPTTVNNAANPSGSAVITSGNTTIGYTVKRFTAGTAMAIVNNTDDLVFNHSDRSNASEVVGNRLSSTAGKYISSIRRDALGHVIGISESDLPTGGGGGGTTTTLGNQGVGNLLVTGSAPAYGIKSIAAGSNVSITESGNTLYINASGGSGGGEVVSASNTATINMTKTGTVLTADIRPHTTNDRKVLQSVSGVVSWGDDNVGSGGTTYTAGNLISLTGNAIAVSGSLTTSRTGTGVVTGTINLSAGTFSLDATVPPPSGGGLSNVTGTDPIVVTDASAGVKNVAVNTFSTAQAGVVPASGSSTKVLRGNGWQDFPTIPDAYVHPAFAPTGPQGGGDRTVRISRDNQGHIETIQDVAITFPVTSVNAMTGAVVIPPYTHPDSGVTVGSAGTSTRVPTLSVNAQGHVTSLSEIDIALPKLYGASDNKSVGNTVNNRGLVPSGSASGTKYLREDGQWQSIPQLPNGNQNDVLVHNGSAWSASRILSLVNNFDSPIKTTLFASSVSYEKPAIWAQSNDGTALFAQGGFMGYSMDAYSHNAIGAIRAVADLGPSITASGGTGSSLRVERKSSGFSANSSEYRPFEFVNVPVDAGATEGGLPSIYGFIKILFNGEAKRIAIYND